MDVGIDSLYGVGEGIKGSLVIVDLNQHGMEGLIFVNLFAAHVPVGFAANVTPADEERMWVVGEDLEMGMEVVNRIGGEMREFEMFGVVVIGDRPVGSPGLGEKAIGCCEFGEDIGHGATAYIIC